MTRDGARGRRLQLWARDQRGAAVEFQEDLRRDPQAHADEGHSADELVAEPAAAANGTQAEAAAAAVNEARAPAPAALGAAAAAAQGGSTSIDTGEAEAAPSRAWRRVEGADFELPEEEGELSIAATPNQVRARRPGSQCCSCLKSSLPRTCVVWLHVRLAQQGPCSSQAARPRPIDQLLPLATAAVQAGRIVLVLQAQRGQQGQQGQQGQPSGGQSTAAAAQPLVLVYDAERHRWSGLQRAELCEVSRLQSGSGSGGGGNSVASAARLRKGAASEPWWIQNVTNPTMACSDFFKTPSLPGRRGAAAQAAAAAGLEAMEAARPAFCKAAHAARSAANGSAEDILASQWRHAVALAVDGRGG